MYMADSIIVDLRKDIGIITINRPEKRNALRQKDWIKLADTLDELGANHNLRCLIIKGAGDAAFCAGADISGFESERSTRQKVKSYEEATARAFDAAHTCQIPVIAMINGFCLGGGFELALGCDLRIAAASAKFGVPAKNVGLFLSYGLLELLIDAGGKANAIEVLLEGRIFTAIEAKSKNLITRIVDDEKLLEEAMAVARNVANGAPLTAKWHRKAIRRIAQSDPYSSKELEEQYDYADSEDYEEGFKSFVEGRKPIFKGK